MRPIDIDLDELNKYLDIGFYNMDYNPLDDQPL